MRITQHTTFLSSLLDSVRKGAMRPAAFQRPYVWGRAEVMALVESILARYPIGSFLTWTPGDAADLSGLGRTRLGPLDCAATGHSLLLDGQNRLATLAWLAQDWSSPAPACLSEQEARTWDSGERFVADLAARKLEFRPIGQADQGVTLPGYCLFDWSLFNREMRLRWGSQWKGTPDTVLDEGLRWFDECVNAFAEARIVVTEMERASAAQAKHAFLHICRVGVPMSEADFDAALGWTQN